MILITFNPIVSKAEFFSPQVKAVVMMAAYGTIGGALLGTASLAFNSNSRSIAKGASLGLYTGLLFGSFIIISYKMKKDRELNPQGGEDYYPDTQGSPYENGGNSDESPNRGNINFNKLDAIENINYQKRHQKILFYMPLFQLNF